jgi:hypothetical protein
MKVKDPGHIFELDWLDVEPGYTAEDLHGYGCRDLVFVKREGEGYPGNVGHYEGTNIQEVLRALISRVKYLDSQVHDTRNLDVLDFLRLALKRLEQRAAERHGRLLDIFSPMNSVRTLEDVWIEELPTCPKCGHIGCEGSCHP